MRREGKGIKMECCSERLSLDRTSKREASVDTGTWEWEVHVEGEGLPSTRNIFSPLYTFSQGQVHPLSGESQPGEEQFCEFTWENNRYLPASESFSEKESL